MKKLLLITLSCACIVATSPAAQAQAWQSINARQAQLDQRIDAGVRDGSLTRMEAANLRTQYRSIANLEARYRRNGLTSAERRDLDRRFDRLSANIRTQRHDDQDRRTLSPNQRQAELNQRIDAGVRNHQLTFLEAQHLRAEYNDIARLEARYRRNGLQPAERRDLNLRLNRLSHDIHDDRHDVDFLWF